MRRFAALVAVLTLLAAPGATRSFAADEKAAARVPTVTRLVKLFSELEATLATTLQHDSVAAGRMLDPDFELRAGRAPGNPTPREDFLRRSLGQLNAYRIEQMAVHDYGDVAIVSFLQAATASKKPGAPTDVFTVDVWKRSGDGWVLAVRYAGPAGGAEAVIPGADTEPPIRKRY